MNSNNKSFLDSNTLLALVLTFIIFLGWQQYVNYKYPPGKKEVVKVSEEKKDTVVSGEINQKQEAKIPAVNAETPEKKVLFFESDFWKFNINSYGMGVEDLVIKKINKVAEDPYKFNLTESFFPTTANGKIVAFDLTQQGNEFVGTAVIGGMKIVKTMVVNSDHYTIDVKINLVGGNKIKIGHQLDAQIEDPKQPIPLLPAFERNELYVASPTTSEREILVTKTVLENPERYNAIKIASLGDHFFAAAILNKGSLSPDLSYSQNKGNVFLKITHDFSDVKVNKAEYKMFLGPKNVELLNQISPELGGIVNFTYLGFIARPILKGLNFLYSILGNYGLAVIVLTILIRLLIMPLAVSSFKSMKRMQLIQPELKKIKEKYKDQPQILNQRTMQLMKDNKVNPLGGCLPMLLQLPIFFAFYRGLSESVDLYQAPFFGWITDLSKMDPYFIFPILSMVGMVIHQLVTPNTMEPLQRKLMLIMPVVFGLLFVTLPSALTLYMAVSTWFGIGQHAIFLREKTA